MSVGGSMGGGQQTVPGQFNPSQPLTLDRIMAMLQPPTQSVSPPGAPPAQKSLTGRTSVFGPMKAGQNKGGAP